jgi:signal transduction histidine kinase
VQKKILIGFLIIIAISVPNGIIGFLKVENTLISVENDVKAGVSHLKNTSRLDHLAVDLLYYDEILTNAARNYAFTSEQKWLDVYIQTKPELDMAVSDAIATSPQKEKPIFDKIAQANAILVDLETQAISLVENGKSADAIIILESENYWNAKSLYSDALLRYSEGKEMDFDHTTDVASEIDLSISKIRNLLMEIQILLYVGIPALLAIAILLSYFISRSISRPIAVLNKTADLISQGDYNVQLQSKSDDEIGRLGQKFQSMINSFKNALETERNLIIAQEQLKTEKLRAIGELAARIAHDLRNPLSVIKNVSELIRMQYPANDPKLQTHFTKLDTSIQRMSHQIDDVLDFVRTTPLEKRITSIKEIIEKSLADMDVPQDILVELPQNDEKIDCDDQKLRTVFSNLILNSIQAIDGKGTISVKLTGYTKHITIDLIDTGSGIPENILPHIFEPLFTTKQQGTGLGLPSCKNIIEQHGGTISAKNNPTAFTITLPRL